MKRRSMEYVVYSEIGIFMMYNIVKALLIFYDGMNLEFCND